MQLRELLEAGEKLERKPDQQRYPASSHVEMGLTGGISSVGFSDSDDCQVEPSASSLFTHLLSVES